MKRLALLLLVPALLFGMSAPEPGSVYSHVYKRNFFFGLKSHTKRMKVEKKFLKADVKVPADFYMPSKWPLPPGLPYDQGQCGSCVVNSINGQATYQLAIRGLLPLAMSPLSRGQTMECNPNAGQCDGDYAENVGGWVVKHGALLSESVYSYRAYNGGCRGITGKEYGPFVSGHVIDNSPKSMAAAMMQGIPVSITVGADDSWMNWHPSQGVYSNCTNQGANHEVLLIGIHCKGSSAKDGFCVFDASGHGKPGEIEYDILNSWGPWGDKGIIHTKATDSRGNLCNNAAEEAYTLDTGVPLPDNSPEPSCSASVAPGTVELGNFVGVSFTSQNAVSATLDGVPLKETAGTYQIKTNGLGFFTVNFGVVGASGKKAACSTQYTVIPAPTCTRFLCGLWCGFFWCDK